MSEVALDPPASPWTGRVNTAAGVAALVSLAVIVLGWHGVSNRATFDDAQPWFVVGVLGLLLGFAVAVVWLNSAAKRIRGVRLECHRLLRAEFGIGVPTTADDAPSGSRYVRAAGMTKVHLDTCELVADKAFDELPALPADAELCGMCRP
jgi:hypothetical protein